MTWKVRVHSLIPVGRIGDCLLIVREDHTGKSYVAGPLVFRKFDHTASFPLEEVIKFESFGENVDDFLRAMADAAWERGIKPTAFTDHAGELAATKKHLEDMRRLANAAPPLATAATQSAADAGHAL